ncbi:MAG: ATP-binding protein [Oscillospiraceae bacterium]|nr:ATP-binding protein [Oscillospiraceae bacterium]
MNTCIDVPEKPFLNRLGRKTIITGHYGSGKTEFAVSLAMLLADEQNGNNSSDPTAQENRPPVLALIDLDIINPYFRSREQKDMLKDTGVAVYGSAFESESTAELPALSASVRAPLENHSCRVIIDTGGNDAGALVLNQFSKYFKDDETTVFAVVNANRPETSDINSAIEHINAIEFITGLNISCIVNNTNLLRETTINDILVGHEFCKKICELTGKHFLCDCYPAGIINPEELSGLSNNLMPLGLYMRPTWLDK